MRGGIRVIRIHRARRFTHALIHHAGVLINGGEIRLPHRAVLVEQQPRAVELAPVVQLLRALEVADGVVDLVALLVEQGGIQPRGRIVRIELLGAGQFMRGARDVVSLGKSFAEITPQQRAIRLHRCRHEQVIHAVAHLARADAAEAAAKPRVAEPVVGGDGFVELRERGSGFVLRGQQKSANGHRLRIAWRKVQRALHGAACLTRVAKTEL